MQPHKEKIIITSIAVLATVAILSAIVWLVYKNYTNPVSHNSPDIVPTPLATYMATPPVETSPSPTLKTLSAQSIPNIAQQFTFSATIPNAWIAEPISSINAVNFYNPAADASTSLEKSQIFIRYFEASDFLTLSTVDILSKSSLTVGNRPAVRYTIKKKPNVSNFPNQPSWRNKEHVVTDVRVSDTNPSVFYVIAKNPELDETTYQILLDSFTVK